VSTLINLLPEQYITERVARRRRRLSLVTTALVILGSSVAWNTCRNEAIVVAREVARAKADVARNGSRDAAVTRLDADAKALAASLAVREAVTLRLPVTTALGAACNALPDSVVLTRVSVEPPQLQLPTGDKKAKPTPRTAAAPVMKVGLEGLAVEDVEIARLVSVLSSNPLFKNVKLKSSRGVKVGELNRSEFQVDLEVPLDREFLATTDATEVEQ
jgi:Tfp pilus assembly protein PilN